MDQTSLVCRNMDTGSACIAQVSHISSTNPDQQAAASGSTFAKGKRLGLLWGMGGTILSVIGFIALAAFEQYNGMLSELRADLKHFNETSGDYVKRDSFQRIREQMKDWYKEMQTVHGVQAQLEQELRASEKAREAMVHELQQMRERLAYVEGRQTATPSGHIPTSPTKQ